MKLAIIFFSVVQLVSAFISKPLSVQRSCNLYSVGTATTTPHEKSGLEELIQMILEALPLAINTPNPEMDKSKIIPNPPAFYKPATASKFRKAQHSESPWNTEDVVNEFNRRYGVFRSSPTTNAAAATAAATPAKAPVSTSQAVKLTQSIVDKMVTDERQALIDLLEELEDMEIVDTVDNQLNKSPSLLAASERYIAGGVTTAFAKLDKPMDKTKMVQNPKTFVKPMSLREIKKKLQNDPDYFKH